MWMLLSYLSLGITYLVRFILPTIQVILFVSFLLVENTSLFILFLGIIVAVYLSLEPQPTRMRNCYGPSGWMITVGLPALKGGPIPVLCRRVE